VNLGIKGGPLVSLADTGPDVAPGPKPSRRRAALRTGGASAWLAGLGLVWGALEAATRQPAPEQSRVPVSSPSRGSWFWPEWTLANARFALAIERPQRGGGF